jgi:hypothetical protein
VAKAAGKQPELHKRPPLSERALAARRMNAVKGGRPAGGMNADKLAFRDRFRAKEVELADNTGVHARRMLRSRARTSGHHTPSRAFSNSDNVRRARPLPRNCPNDVCLSG